MNTEETTTEDVIVEEVVKSVVPEKSKGQLFKEKYGYSKTLSRNMKKKGCTTPQEYRANYKTRRAAEAVVKRAKHMRAVAGQKTKSAVGKQQKA